MKPVKVQLGKTKREKILIFALIMAVIAVAYFNIFLRPTIGDMATFLPKVAVLKRDLADARSLIANKDVIEARSGKLQSLMDEYREIFPGHKEIPKLLENLSSIASASGVKIIGIKPLTKEDFNQESEKGEVYQEIPIEIVARSGYHQLGLFLQKLETGDRFIMVKGIKISANPHSTKRHNVELIASTYILKEK